MARFVNVSTLSVDFLPACDSRNSDQIISHLQHALDQVLPTQPDLIVLPECCSLYLDQNMQQYMDDLERYGQPIADFFTHIAKTHRTYITHPTLHRENDGRWYNQVRLLGRDGELVGRYAKYFPTISEIEEGISPGTETPLFECDFGRVGCVICFDLNFDELRNAYMQQKPDLMLFCSMFHGSFRQQNWAFACQSHWVSAIANLPSGVLTPVGNTVASTTNYVNHVSTRINLDCAVIHLDCIRGNIQQKINRQYGREVTLYDPGLLGPILLTSESQTRSIDQIMSEFELETIDAYLNRSKEMRDEKQVANKT